MRRIDADYRVIISLNSMLILLGAFGIITPAASATMHNLSTIGISLYNMTDLIEASGGHVEKDRVTCVRNLSAIGVST